MIRPVSPARLRIIPSIRFSIKNHFRQYKLNINKKLHKD
jgi:hypothetical protein